MVNSLFDVAAAGADVFVLPSVVDAAADADETVELPVNTGIELSPFTMFPVVVVVSVPGLNVVYPPVGPVKVAGAVTKMITMLLGGVAVVVVLLAGKVGVSVDGV